MLRNGGEAGGGGGGDGGAPGADDGPHEQVTKLILPSRLSSLQVIDNIHN